MSHFSTKWRLDVRYPLFQQSERNHLQLCYPSSLLIGIMDVDVGLNIVFHLDVRGNVYTLKSFLELRHQQLEGLALC